MIRIVHDGRLGRFTVPPFARCQCGAKVGEAHRDARLLGCAMTCPKCGKKWIIPFSHPTHAQNLRAPNDPNGNPGRCWVLYDSDGMLCDAIDEGYRGRPKIVDNLVTLPPVEVSRGEYKAFLKEGELATGHREEA